MNINNLPEFLKTKEVAELFRVSPLTVKRWSNRGQIPCIQMAIRGQRRYKREDILHILNGKKYGKK